MCPLHELPGLSRKHTDKVILFGHRPNTDYAGLHWWKETEALPSCVLIFSVAVLFPLRPGLSLSLVSVCTSAILALFAVMFAALEDHKPISLMARQDTFLPSHFSAVVLKALYPPQCHRGDIFVKEFLMSFSDDPTPCLPYRPSTCLHWFLPTVVSSLGVCSPDEGGWVLCLFVGLSVCLSAPRAPPSSATRSPFSPRSRASALKFSAIWTTVPICRVSISALSFLPGLPNSRFSPREHSSGYDPTGTTPRTPG